MNWALRVGAIAAGSSATTLATFYVACVTMPGESFEGSAAASTPSEELIRTGFERHVRKLAEEIGERNLHARPEALERAEAYITSELEGYGYVLRRQAFSVEGERVANLEAKLPNDTEQVVVVGAHYDSAHDTPAANDNGSGVAALLEVARVLSGRKFARELRFVAFTNEEPPYFQTELMGSWQYARECSERDEQVVAMLSLETLGYYSDEPGSQQYPPVASWFYPSRGDFLAFVGNLPSRQLARRSVGAFRNSGAQLPSEGGALPASLPGVGWSDHWAFWQFDYPAVMVTDTAPFRYPHYHTPEDTFDKLDLERSARAVAGLVEVVIRLAND